MTQFGLYSQTTSAQRRQAPRVANGILITLTGISRKRTAATIFNALHGINVDAGIFMSYIGLFSYYQFDNWAYQPSYVFIEHIWFFNGVRIQIFRRST